MKVNFDCIPCMLRQTIETVRHCNMDEKVQKESVNKVLNYLQTIDYELTPPQIGKDIYKIISEVTGIDDPYKDQKLLHNKMALELYDEIQNQIDFTKDPMFFAAKLSAAGNVIDFGVEKKIADVSRIVHEAQNINFTIDDFENFKTDLGKSKFLLYLLDNAGEIVFDKLFIETIKKYYPEIKITAVVRGAPVINDVTLEDARFIRLTEIVEVIENGDSAPATVLSDISDEMKYFYTQADLILSKGQGNFETLHDQQKLIYFVFKVKCPVIAKEVNIGQGSLVFKRNNFRLN